MSLEKEPLDPGKDAAAVRVFPPLVPAVLILLGVLLQYLRPIDVGSGLPSQLRYWTGGLIFGAAILGLGAFAIVTFRRAGESELPWTATGKLVVWGPYRFTRNPMYLQLILVCVGAAVLLMNIWILLLTPVCAWLLRHLAIAPEEEYLERRFGDVYLAYKQRVRRWL